MGGIKNKLSKLSSNKVKNLLSSLSLTERADERSSSGEVINNTTNSKSSGFCHLIRQTPSATFPVKGKELTPPFRKKGAQDLLWDQRRQMKSGRISIGGFDRVVKYTGLACLSIAILSTITLNIISTYSSSNINSNAEQVGEVSTFANISSHSATGDTNDGNLSLSIPQGGGLVAGRHTVSVDAGNEIDSYSVFLNGGTNKNGVDNTDLVNTMADSLPNTGSLTTSISSLAWSGDFSVIDSFPMQGNAWGVALPDNYPGLYNDKSTYESLITSPDSSSNGPMYTFSGIPPISDGQRVPNQPLMGNEIIRQEDNSLASIDIYYGVKVDDSSTMLAGDYTTNVVYTVIAELKTPSITSISPNPIRTGTANRITLEGNNLSIVIRDCTNIAHSGTNNDTTITCTLPAISNTGTYVITAEAEGGQTATTQIQLIPPAPTISSVSPNEINTNDSTATLTIVGTNLATTSSIYVDFNNNNKADSGEACTVKAITNPQITCTAPNRSTAGGPYTVRLTTDGGSASKAGAVSYVTPVPVITKVSPSEVKSLSSFYQDVNFTVTGNNLDSVRKITLYLDGDISGGTNQQDCSIWNSSSSSLTCTVYSWSLVPAWGNKPIRAEMYDAGDVLLGASNAFCMANSR